MKLYTAQRAPNPRRVLMFIHEKAITGIELVPVDLNAGEHKGAAYRALNPVATVPTLELPDGRTEGYLFREIEFVIEGKRTARTDGTGCVLKK